MRGLILNLLIIMLASVGGVLLMRGLGRDPHLAELITAAIAALLASELALVPLIITRRGNQATVSQAALVATMVHLMVAGSFAAVVFLAHLPLGQAFVYWLLTFYWLTLITVAAECVRAIRHASPASAAQP